MYFALIGDIVGSKKLPPDERRKAQERFNSALDAVNREMEGSIAADFLITLGDECQGLLLPEGDAVFAAVTIMHLLRPYKIRVAIGAGDISTPINRTAAIGADGPAFHNCRRMAEQMKMRHGARLRCALEDGGVEENINIVLALCDRLAADWTDKQEQAVYHMLTARLKDERLTQTELAQRLGIGQPTLNAQLAAAGFNEYCAGLLYVRDVLNKYVGAAGGEDV